MRSAVRGLHQRVPKAMAAWRPITAGLYLINGQHIWGEVLQIWKAGRLYIANNLLVWVILKLTEGIQF